MTDPLDETAPVAPGERLGDFELLTVLGSGTMGTVFRARQVSMDREVAVKVIHPHLARDPNLVERFVREAQTAGRLRHPNIVAGISAGEAHGQHYFAMELVDGEGLDRAIAREKRIPGPRAASLVGQIARGLEHAHENGIVHRDLKPSNIILDRDGAPKIADLGLAKALVGSADLTHHGGVIGTPAYMAPEQAIDSNEADHRSDIYSLGVTFYETITGEKPFPGDTATDVFRAKRGGTYRSASEIAPDLPAHYDGVLAKMIATDPERRYQSAAEIVEALEAIENQAVSESSQSRVGFVKIGAAALGTFVVIAGAIYIVREYEPPGSGDTPPVRAAAQLPTATVPAGQIAGAEGEQAKITLGVMLFEIRGGTEEDAWKGEAIRDLLNTQLSQLSGVKVYSKEFIDFVVSRKKLSQIEAAEELGISTMLSGSIQITGERMRIETHAVNVETGVLEASYTTLGSVDKFLDLQRQLVIGSIARLDLPITADERLALRSGLEAPSVDALKLLLEAEAEPAEDTDSSTEPTSLRLELDRGIALGWRLLGPAAAYGAVAEADPPTGSGDGAPADAETEIRNLLTSYGLAAETGDVEQLIPFYVELSPDKRTALAAYFDNVEDLKVDIEDVDVVIAGDEAIVSYTRTDDFVDRRTGRPMHVSVRLTKLLKKQDGVWRLAGSK